MQSKPGTRRADTSYGAENARQIVGQIAQQPEIAKAISMGLER